MLAVQQLRLDAWKVQQGGWWWTDHFVIWQREQQEKERKRREAEETEKKAAEVATTRKFEIEAQRKAREQVAREQEQRISSELKRLHEIQDIVRREIELLEFISWVKAETHSVIEAAAMRQLAKMREEEAVFMMLMFMEMN